MMDDQQSKGTGGESAPKEPKFSASGVGMVGVAQVGLFFLALFYVMHEMKPVLLPLVLALLVSMIVYPIYLVFRKMRVPRILSAFATVTGLSAMIAFGSYQAILPGAEWLRTMDQAEVLGRLQEAVRPVKVVHAEIEMMADRVEEATNMGSVDVTQEVTKEGEPSLAEELEEVAEDVTEPDTKLIQPETDQSTEVMRTETKIEGKAPMQVEIHEDSVSMMIGEARDFGLSFVAFLLLVLFLLAYGNQILEQLNRKEHFKNILSRVGGDVSKYLSTVALINLGLGVCIALAMWGLGMPRPVLWGVMAAILNFVPYVGALGGTFVVFVAAVINFQEPTKFLAVPAVYFLLTAIEGNFVTPMALGGRFRINPLVVFVWIFAWAGFWGVSGVLIAMPALVIFKIICENTEKMETVRRVLSA